MSNTYIFGELVFLKEHKDTTGKGPEFVQYRGLSHQCGETVAQ